MVPDQKLPAHARAEICMQRELANSIENTIAIAFLSTIAIAIAIDKAIFQLLLLLLLLIRASSNY